MKRIAIKTGNSIMVDNIMQFFDSHEMFGKKCIIYLSTQVNGYPHIGTMTNIISGFLLAKKIHNHFGNEVKVVVELLDCIESDRKYVSGDEYYQNYDNKSINKIYSKYKMYFVSLIDYISSYVGVDFEIERYSEYLNKKLVREIVIEVIQNRNKVGKYINLKNGNLRIRFPCPHCNYIHRHNDNLIYEYVSSSKVELVDSCPSHGEHKCVITPNNTEFFDMNVQLRTFVKILYFYKSDIKNNTFTIPVDGYDWTGMWPLKNYFSSMFALGYHFTPNIFYSPLIVDEYGLKLSKTAFLEGKFDYKEEYEYLFNFKIFLEKKGHKALNKYIQAIEEWMSVPEYFFRNYSIEYIHNILKDM